MSGQRGHFSAGLVLLLLPLCALSGHGAESARSADPTGAAAATARQPATGIREAQQDARRIVKMAKQAEAPFASQAHCSPAIKEGGVKTVVLLRDLRKKEKFLKHITGPLYFSPKCRKHVYRLYHHTRDCTIPAYFKRCARLLTRLAGSPQCTEG